MNWYRWAKSALVDNVNFRNWFGNSKVVDSAGQPLRVYKGMWPYDYHKEDKSKGYPGPELDTIKRKEPFPSFDPSDQEPVHLAGFFTDDPSVAEKFMFNRGGMYAVYLRIENPKVFDAAGKPAGTVQFGAEGKPFRDAVRSGEYDGVIIMNTSDEGNVYIPFAANQIKSAIGNKGTFDPKDDRFSY